MAKLIYSMITSLDGYIEDRAGNFDWAAPDDEVHAFVNDIERSVGSYLYGRRIYETMAYWETADGIADQPAVELEYAGIWQAADKIVYSTTLATVSTARTRIERAFEPDAVRRLKASSDRDITVSGPELARHAMVAGLVDEFRLFVVPIIVGGGKAVFPEGVTVSLELLDERRFGNGAMYLCYRSSTA